MPGKAEKHQLGWRPCAKGNLPEYTAIQAGRPAAAAVSAGEKAEILPGLL